ncbi:ImmA/IrrE family metallo-endopeptidase [Leptospira kanakyensis]|uniref:ImmA/IrrE family metallo-endopeptidase n=1 Tax=Leptospira kanakyensis TaxID=2484968 RepID=UPI00223E5224|nr:ImmA/IrrE family metallo-endopeptidase [Leptospira kanakyensis]MCW7482273.1 ImmA/IrrE family metallo-endopeptidase [Leptospira kanakyensis]
MISIPGYDQATPTGKSKNEVFKAAESIAKHLRYKAGDELDSIVTELGGRIHYLNLHDWFSTQEASIWVHGENHFDIFLSNFSSPLRNRFSIAHELGHYYLHSLEGKVKLIAARSGSHQTEWEANWFAAAFLMPEAEFKAACKKYNEDMDYVAAHFLVSRKAADVRFNSIFGS